MSRTRSMLTVAALSSAALLSGCGYNDFQRLDEEVKGGWSEVLNQYQRRSDLIPNIVATVKGEAGFARDFDQSCRGARQRDRHPGHA